MPFWFKVAETCRNDLERWKIGVEIPSTQMINADALEVPTSASLKIVSSMSSAMVPMCTLGREIKAPCCISQAKIRIMIHILIPLCKTKEKKNNEGKEELLQNSPPNENCLRLASFLILPWKTQENLCLFETVISPSVCIILCMCACVCNVHS